MYPVQWEDSQSYRELNEKNRLKYQYIVYYTKVFAVFVPNDLPIRHPVSEKAKVNNHQQLLNTNPVPVLLGDIECIDWFADLAIGGM
ncbi:hypothetical protein Barb6XT_03026 [Bacteroidales bacterium Barb6XT]|nr:hypothetical protein Barb6XT_03026 [Bacteroidales bacterium Barb6XT]